MGASDTSALLARKRAALEDQLHGRDELKKSYTERMETYKKDINALRQQIQQIEDGDYDDDEEESDTEPVQDKGKSVLAKEEVSDQEDEPIAVPTHGMMADSVQGIWPTKKHLRDDSPVSSDDEPSLPVRGMIADSEDATRDGRRQSVIPPGFEERARANAGGNGTEERLRRRSANMTSPSPETRAWRMGDESNTPQSAGVPRDRSRRTSVGEGREPRDVSPSTGSERSAVQASERPKPADANLLPRPLRHKTARPVQQIYVPPRYRSSNGEHRMESDREDGPIRQAQLPSGVRVSMGDIREHAPRPASYNGLSNVAERLQDPTGGAHLDRNSQYDSSRDDLFPAMNGQAGLNNVRASPNGSSQRIPISQRLSNPGRPTEVPDGAFQFEQGRGRDQIASQQPVNRDSFPFSVGGDPEPKWSSLLAENRTTDPATAKLREWDAHKSADPQSDIHESERLQGQRRVGNWADTEVNDAADGPGQNNGLVLRGAWGSGNVRDKIRDGVNPNLTKLGSLPQRSVVDDRPVEVRERQAGLRHPDDESADAERRKQMKSDRELRYMDSVRGRDVNVLQGLELHVPVLDETEQSIMKAAIDRWCELGSRGQLKGRTYSAPRKWARGKGRITIQFGCCYNYAKDAQGRLPGIIAEEVVEDMPKELVALASRLVRWGILPKSMEPDSAIVNIYEVDDCIPPHIDHHDFSRPFCTISLLSEEAIMFGQKLVPEGPGEFHGLNNRHTLIDLPKGSCLVLNGNGADIAMHCVPPVRNRRMSITLRRMGAIHAAKVKAEIARTRSGRLLPVVSYTMPDELPVEKSSVNLADYIKIKK